MRVAEIERVASRIKRFRLVDADGGQLPAFSGGAHVVVGMKHRDQLWRNPYSLMSSPDDTSSYQISVLRTEDSRGGSAFMHEEVRVGSELEIAGPVNLFPIARMGRKHVLVAGGIGITPFMSMMYELSAAGADFELHYGVRSLEHGAYCNHLRSEYGDRVHIYDSSKEQRLPLEQILQDQPLGSHMYVCGPKAMIDWALHTGTAAGWPDESLHSERFGAPANGTPFVIKLARSSREIRVDGHQSILEALEQNGVDAPYLCRGGACGHCETAVIETDGELQHNDHYLSDDERRTGKKIMICVSRTSGKCMTLDL
jgi:ferredoxin-NADP reductase